MSIFSSSLGTLDEEDGMQTWIDRSGPSQFCLVVVVFNCSCNSSLLPNFHDQNELFIEA